MRFAERLDPLRRIMTARDELFDLGNRTIGDLQTQSDQRRRTFGRIGVVLFQRTNECDLPHLDVADEQAIATPRLHATPKTIADSQSLTVLRVASGCSDRRGFWIVLDDRIEVSIDEPFEALPITGAWLCGGAMHHDTREHDGTRHDPNEGLQHNSPADGRNAGPAWRAMVATVGGERQCRGR